MTMQRLPLATFGGSNFVRMFSSADVVDEMIAYARTNANVGLVKILPKDPHVSNVLNFLFFVVYRTILIKLWTFSNLALAFNKQASALAGK